MKATYSHLFSKKKIIGEFEMKKLTVLLIMLIIVSQIPICPFAFEATSDEKNAIAYAYNYLNRYELKVYFDNYEDDLSIGTIGHRGADNSINKEEILEKAREYEDEIKENHCYYFQDEISTGFGYDRSKSAYALQYENTPIEEVIASFPVFIEKKAQYLNAYYRNLDVKAGGGMFMDSPESVTVSESGFAYVSFGCVRLLLYKCQPPNQIDSHGVWVICDIFENGDNFGSKYRFNSENMDVEKELLSAGILPLSESKSTEPSSEVKDDKETVNSPKENEPAKESEPINYIPWAICTAEGVAIIALVTALVLKKKK